MHIKYDAIAPVIYRVYRKNILLQLAQLAEVKLTKPATSFNQSGKMNHFSEMYLHKALLE
jgi:hypothetical protein